MEICYLLLCRLQKIMYQVICLLNTGCFEDSKRQVNVFVFLAGEFGGLSIR